MARETALVLWVSANLAVIVYMLTAAGLRYAFVQASMLCTKSRAKKVVVGLTLVSLTFGYFLTDFYSDQHYARYMINRIMYFTLYVVVPLAVLIINSMLIREMRRASHNAAANPRTLVIVPVFDSQVLVL